MGDFSSSGCEDGIELLFSGSLATNFSNAQEICIDLGGTLAVPNTASKFQRMRNLGFNQNPYYGLLDPTDPQVKLDKVTNRFLTFPGGKPNPFSSGEAAVFPWDAGNPNDNFQNQDCVFSLRNLLNDVNCLEIRPFMCEVFCNEETPVLSLAQCNVETDIQYALNFDERNLDGSIADCQRIDLAGSLATPLNSTDLEVLQQLVQSSGVNEAFVGFVDFFDVGGSNATRFQTVTGEFSDFTGTDNSVWAVNEPDDVDGNENCVVLQADGQLRDVDCVQELPSLCQVSCLTNQVPIEDDSILTPAINASLIVITFLLIIISSLKWYTLNKELKQVVAGIRLYTLINYGFIEGLD